MPAQNQRSHVLGRFSTSKFVSIWDIDGPSSCSLCPQNQTQFHLYLLKQGIAVGKCTSQANMTVALSELRPFDDSDPERSGICRSQKEMLLSRELIRNPTGDVFTVPIMPSSYPASEAQGASMEPESGMPLILPGVHLDARTAEAIRRPNAFHLRERGFRPQQAIDGVIPLFDLVVVVDASWKNIKLLLNCIVSLFELGVRMDNVIVLAYDNKTATSMSSAGFTVAFDPHIQEVAETIKKQSGCQPMWFHAMFQRQMLWNELIDIGVTFWHTDADTAYYRDPTEDLRSGAVHVRYTGEKTDMTADVSSGWVHPFEKLANGSFQTWHINNGVGGVAPLATPNLRDLWLGWYRDRCLSNVCKDGWAAIEMNLWLHEKGLHVVADTSTTLEGDLVGLFADEVKVSVFQPRTKYLYGDPAEPYLVHACGITDPYDKEQHLKFYYGWFVLDMFLEDAIHRLASGTQQDFVTPLHLIRRIRVQPRNDLTMVQGRPLPHLA